MLQIKGVGAYFCMVRPSERILGGLGQIFKVGTFSYCADARWSEGLPPRKILKNFCSEIEAGGISGSIYLYTSFQVSNLLLKCKAISIYKHHYGMENS